MAQGFTAVKLDPAGPYSTFDPRQPSLERLELCEAFLKTLREAVGTKCDLLFGTHGQFTVSGALRLARRIEAYEPLWFEEPTPPEAPEEMAKVAAQCRMPIATGERLTTEYEFARVLESGAASILQMNLGRVGGILEAKKIAGMAEPIMRKSRRTSIAGRSSARPTSSSQPAAEFSHPREHRALGRLPCSNPEKADPLGGGLRHSVGRAGPRRRAQRGCGPCDPSTGARPASHAKIGACIAA